MYEIAKWRRGRTLGDGITAVVTCPKCGQWYSITGHKIDGEGVITPSMVCPTKGCDFHEQVQLKGYPKAPPDPEDEPEKGVSV